MKPIIYYSEIDSSSMGPLTILATDKGVCKIQFGSLESSTGSLQRWSKKTIPCSELISGEFKLQPVASQIIEYFRGERKSFHFDIDFHGTAFQQKVWKELLNIPYGETKSYKEMAQAIFAPKAVRAIGGAVNKNPIPIVVPCHRVIGSNGSLVGYNGGLDKKEKLLVLENALEKIS